MSTLLVWREKLQRIYALYSIYIQKRAAVCDRAGFVLGYQL